MTKDPLRARLEEFRRKELEEIARKCNVEDKLKVNKPEYIDYLLEKCGPEALRLELGDSSGLVDQKKSIFSWTNFLASIATIIGLILLLLTKCSDDAGDGILSKKGESSAISDTTNLNFTKEGNPENEIDTLLIIPFTENDSTANNDSISEYKSTAAQERNSKAVLTIVKVFSPKPGLVELQLLNESEKVVLITDVKFNDTLTPTSANFYRNNTKVYQTVIHNSDTYSSLCDNTTFAFKRPIAVSQEIPPQSSDRFSIELKLEESLVKRKFDYNGTITLYYNVGESVVSDFVTFKIQ